MEHFLMQPAKVVLIQCRAANKWLCMWGHLLSSSLWRIGAACCTMTLSCTDITTRMCYVWFGTRVLLLHEWSQQQLSSTCLILLIVVNHVLIHIPVVTAHVQHGSRLLFVSSTLANLLHIYCNAVRRSPVNYTVDIRTINSNFESSCSHYHPREAIWKSKSADNFRP